MWSRRWSAAAALGAPKWVPMLNTTVSQTKRSVLLDLWKWLGEDGRTAMLSKLGIWILYQIGIHKATWVLIRSHMLQFYSDCAHRFGRWVFNPCVLKRGQWVNHLFSQTVLSFLNVAINKVLAPIKFRGTLNIVQNGKSSKPPFRSIFMPELRSHKISRLWICWYLQEG